MVWVTCYTYAQKWKPYEHALHNIIGVISGGSVVSFSSEDIDSQWSPIPKELLSSIFDEQGNVDPTFKAKVKEWFPGRITDQNFIIKGDQPRCYCRDFSIFDMEFRWCYGDDYENGIRTIKMPDSNWYQ